MAQAGGRDPEKLPDALATARAEIEQALPRLMCAHPGSRPRVARCGCADLRSIRYLATAAGRWSSGRTPGGAGGGGPAGRGAARSSWCWWDCRSRWPGRRARRPEARAFAHGWTPLHVPVELHDERLTTRQAERTGGEGGDDSRAAAHLLEAYLAALAPGPRE